MADSKLSALTAATPAGPDLVYLVQGGNPRRGTAQGIANLATRATVGLGNADNTSDLNKPISTATQTALDGKAATGAIGSSGLTMTAGVLGRESGTGAPVVLTLSGLSIVNGVLTVSAGGSGTVTSVGLSVPAGFAVAGSPVTTSGTLALSFAAGYSLPLTSTQANWDAAAVLAGTAVQPAGLANYVQTSDARLTDSREWSATTINQAEAEAGTGTTRRAFTAVRVFQAVAAYIAANFSATGQALATAANAAAARTTLGLGTSSTHDVAATGDAASGQVVKGNDTRLTDARTPAAHNQAASTISDSTATGRAVLTAADAAAARTAIGAGTSSVAVSSTAPAALAATAAAGSSTDAARADHAHQRDTEVIVIPVGDESTALTTGTNKVRFRLPFAATLLAVRANVNTAPTGSTLIVDINEAGTSVLGTKLSIDATETSSTTAASAATITDSSLADDAEISIDVDQIGSTIAGAGLKVSLFVRRA